MIKKITSGAQWLKRESREIRERTRRCDPDWQLASDLTIMPLLSTWFSKPSARWEGGKIQGSQKTCLKLRHYLLEGREKC
jgi:hypothetical protein